MESCRRQAGSSKEVPRGRERGMVLKKERSPWQALAGNAQEMTHTGHNTPLKSALVSLGCSNRIVQRIN